MAKRKYTAAEKAAFKRGMAVQYNKEHPKFGYAVANKITNYNADGSVYGKPYYSSLRFFKTEAEAKEAVASSNKLNKLVNDRVLKAVKAKKVNVYNSDDSRTEWTVYKKIKPTRDTSRRGFEFLE